VSAVGQPRISQPRISERSVSKSSDLPYFDLPHPWIHNQTDPYAIASGAGWYVAPHGKVLGWIQQYDEYPPDSWQVVHLFGVWSHGIDDDGRRLWLQSRKSLGSAVAFIRQHAGELAALTARIGPDPSTLR
jgi:hypothetical protein